MSIVASPVVNNSLVKQLSEVCYDNNLVLSQGIFLGDNPLRFSLPVLLLEVSLIFITCSIIQYFLKPLNQSRMVSQILTGLLLGRSALGRSDFFSINVFPVRGTFILDTFSVLCLNLFLFSIGVKTDVSDLRKAGKKAVAIGLLGSFLPWGVAMWLSHVFKKSFPPDVRDPELIFQLILRLSLSSFAVVADTLDELGLLNSDLGRIATSAALITDIINWTVTTSYNVWGLINMSADLIMMAMLLAPVVICFVLVVFIARPLSRRIAKRTPQGELLGEGSYVSMVVGAVLVGYITEISGYPATLGPFVLGLSLPSGMPFGVTVRERLDSFLSGLLLPVYLVLAGYRMDFSDITGFDGSGCLEMIFVVCYVGRLVGTVLAALCFRMQVRDALTVALMLNIRGIIEVFFLNNWSDAQQVNVQHFTLLTVTVLINTAVTTPLIKFLYNPTTRYIARKRRTIQHAKPNAQLRVLVCVHNEDNVAPLLDLLEASHPTQEAPISVIVLHLTELVGRAASVIRPYKKSKHRSLPTPSDRIANAFRYFEQQGEGVISVHPYVTTAPYSTMHNDICSLAHNKKARLIILPYHKQSDGARETARHSIRGVNSSVLDHAPCSVAVLVDRGLPAATCNYTNHLLQRVAVYFIGGADDREALAYGMRIAEADSITLTVVRFTQKGEAQEVDAEAAQLDEEILLELRNQKIQKESIMYVEKAVADGEAMVSVVNSMSEKFDLLIVGRRAELESDLTKGMSEWSECPELGVLGDMLALTEFGEKVSILVVQQQKRVSGGLWTDDIPRGQLGAMGAIRSNAPKDGEVKDVLIHRDVELMGRGRAEIF